MALITKATVLIGGTVISKIDSVDISAEDVSEGVVLMDEIDFSEKTPIPGFTLNVTKGDDVVEPDWSSFNGQLAVIQEIGGKRHDFSEIQLKTEGAYKISRDSTKEIKAVEYMAKKRNSG